MPKFTGYDFWSKLELSPELRRQQTILSPKMIAAIQQRLNIVALGLI
ncbi:hypothetical protein [Brasilonema bromeliae]|nr:hypothetical protein [Brasilonema bromeliae]